MQDTISATTIGSNINDAITFFSEEYFEAGWRRASVVAKAVAWGFNVLLTDVDIVWFQNPYSYLARVPEVGGMACTCLPLCPSHGCRAQHFSR